MRVNWVGIPKPFRDGKLGKGDVISYNDDEITGIRWMDKRPVAVLSTIHDSAMTTASQRSRQATGGVETIQWSVNITSTWEELILLTSLSLITGSMLQEVVEESIFPSIGSQSSEFIHTILFLKPCTETNSPRLCY